MQKNCLLECLNEGEDASGVLLERKWIYVNGNYLLIYREKSND